MAQSKPIKKRKVPTGRDHALAVGVVILAFVLLFLLLTSQLKAINKFSLSVFLLIICGIAIQKLEGFAGAFGFYTAGTTKGVAIIERASKSNRSLWEGLAMWGVVLGFGLASYPLLKGKIDKKILALGIITLLFMQLFLLQYLSYPLQFINISQITSRVQPTGLQIPTLYDYLISLLDVVFGFSGYLIFAIWLNAASILLSIGTVLNTLSSGHLQTTALANQIPGVAPVLPGITIPLVSGILALAVILIIHEFSHGVLARIKKLGVKSVGMPVFGIIPIGGYVEIDEKRIGKLSNVDQTQIFSAGIASNLLATIVFLLLLLPMIYFLVPHLYTTEVIIVNTTKGYPAYDVIPNNTALFSWNGRPTANITALENAASSDLPGTTVRISTASGNYSFVAVASPTTPTRGVIGVNLSEKTTLASRSLAAQAWAFIYSFVSLAFLLNFLVGTINLLPFPMMDGWRIYKTNMNGKLVSAFAIIIIIGLVINILPWFAIL